MSLGVISQGISGEPPGASSIYGYTDSIEIPYTSVVGGTGSARRIVLQAVLLRRRLLTVISCGWIPWRVAVLRRSRAVELDANYISGRASHVEFPTGAQMLGCFRTYFLPHH